MAVSTPLVAPVQGLFVCGAQFGQIGHIALRQSLVKTPVSSSSPTRSLALIKTLPCILHCSKPAVVGVNYTLCIVITSAIALFLPFLFLLCLPDKGNLQVAVNTGWLGSKSTPGMSHSPKEQFRILLLRHMVPCLPA